MNNFPGPVRSLRMLKYKKKTAFTYNIQSVVHCRKFRINQNVDVSCSEFRWTYLHYCSLFPFEPQEKCMTINDIFHGLSRTLSFNFQDFWGPKWFSRNFQVLEFSRKNPGLSSRRGNPAAVFRPSHWKCIMAVQNCGKIVEHIIRFRCLMNTVFTFSLRIQRKVSPQSTENCDSRT